MERSHLEPSRLWVEASGLHQLLGLATHHGTELLPEKKRHLKRRTVHLKGTDTFLRPRAQRSRASSSSVSPGGGPMAWSSNSACATRRHFWEAAALRQTASLRVKLIESFESCPLGFTHEATSSRCVKASEDKSCLSESIP